MERLGCWQLLGPRRASRASIHFTPLPPPLSFSPPFLPGASELLCKALRDGGVLLSLDISKISCLRDAGLIWGLSHHLRCAPHLGNMQSRIWNHIHPSKIWPCGWPFQTFLRDGDCSHDFLTFLILSFFVTMVIKPWTLSSVNCLLCVLH